MDAGHDDIQLFQELRVLVQRPVLEDVHLDAGEDAERRQFGIQLGDDVQLLAEAVGIEPVGDGQAGAVVGEGPVAVPELHRRLGHLPDWAPPVRPVRVAVTVALERFRAAWTPRRSMTGWSADSSFSR